MGRNIMAVGAGIVIAVLLTFAVQTVIPYLAGPVGIDPQENPAAYMQAMPAGALMGVLIGYLVASLAGGFVAGRLAGRAWAAWVVAGLLMAGAVANVMMLPHPVWFIVAAFVLIAAGGWFAGLMAAGGALPAEADEEPAGRAPEPEPRGWTARDEAAPEPEPQRPRWTPLPPRDGEGEDDL